MTEKLYYVSNSNTDLLLSYILMLVFLSIYYIVIAAPLGREWSDRLTKQVMERLEQKEGGNKKTAIYFAHNVTH